MIQLKLAELRKRNNLTQRELGEILSVSYQTISKWENGLVSPDISVLPQISRYFGVSVDALLGLEPLDQEYRPSQTDTAEYWARRLAYMKRTRKVRWNEDYLHFLVRDVWKITEPVTVLDCGCGYGALGLQLLPFLPQGSHYVGIDFTEDMIKEAEAIFRKTDYDAQFICADIMEYEPPRKYDIVISQAVLRHVNHGEAVLRRMVEFVKPGGLVVSIETNRVLEAAGLYIEGIEYEKLCPTEGLFKRWKTELMKQDRDYSIAMKIPHYMKRLGLSDIECRMADKVAFLEPEQENYEDTLERVISIDRWTEEKPDSVVEARIALFMNHGMDRKEAEDVCRQQNEIAHYLKEHRGEVSVTRVMGMLISFGRK